jgi:hypothetical protein
MSARCEAQRDAVLCQNPTIWRGRKFGEDIILARSRSCMLCKAPTKRDNGLACGCSMLEMKRGNRGAPPTHSLPATHVLGTRENDLCMRQQALMGGSCKPWRMQVAAINNLVPFRRLRAHPASGLLQMPLRRFRRGQTRARWPSRGASGAKRARIPPQHFPAAPSSCACMQAPRPPRDAELRGC